MRLFSLHSIYLFIILLVCSCKDQGASHIDSKIVTTVPTKYFTTSVNNTKIHFTHYGSGPTLVALVHGWSCDQSYWSEQVDFLKDKYQVVTIDLAGHGKSSIGNREDWVMKAFAHDVNNVLQELSYDQLVLVGHSMGSAVVLEAAANMETDDLKVVCVDYLKRQLMPLTKEMLDPQMTPMKEDFKAASKPFIASMFTASADSTMQAWITEDMSSAPPHEAVAMIYGLMGADLDQPINALNKRDIPTYIVNADYTPTDKELYIEKGFEIDIIEDTGHFLMMEKPEEFNASLAAIIQSAKSK